MQLRFITAAAAVLVLGACSSDVVKVTQPDSTQIPWTIPLDIKAATMALGDVQQLTATPRNVAGEPVAGTPLYRSLDTSKVKVDATGKVTAVGLSPYGINIIASITANGLTIADTALIAVTATRGTFSSIAITSAGGPPLPTVSVGGYQFLGYDARDDDGNQLYFIPVSFRSFNTKAQTIASSGYMQGVGIGTGKIELKTTIYGVTRADTIDMRTIYPSNVDVLLYGSPLAFDHLGIAIAVGGTVSWTNYGAADSGAVNFPDGGATDIPSLQPGVPAYSTFTVVGVYRYVNPYTGSSGKIYVRENE